MTDLYAGTTIKLSHHRMVSVTECSKCNHLMIRVDKDKLDEDDLDLIETLDLHMAVEHLGKDICTVCEEEKFLQRQAKAHRAV